MPSTNGVMTPYFHWRTPDDGSLWREVTTNAAPLAAPGFSSLWLTYEDATPQLPMRVRSDADRCAVYPCPPGSVSVWIPVVVPETHAAPHVMRGAT